MTADAERTSVRDARGELVENGRRPASSTGRNAESEVTWGP